MENYMDLDFNRNFTVQLEDGSSITASIIVNFEYGENKYCIYSMNGQDEVNIYCAKNIDGQLIKIINSEEQAFVSTVVNKIVEAIKER